jgi:hypothetical protein
VEGIEGMQIHIIVPAKIGDFRESIDVFSPGSLQVFMFLMQINGF